MAEGGGGENVGYAMLPVTLAFEGITKDIASHLGVPLKNAAAKAGKDAGSAIADGVAGAKSKVDAATTKVAQAYKKVEDQAGKLRVAEAQLQALRDRGVTDAGRLAAAQEKVAKAERDLTQAKNGHKNAAGSLTQAEKNHAAAAKQAADAENQAARASKNSADANGLAQRAASKAGRAYDDLTAKAKGFGKTIAAGIGFGAGMNISGITSSLIEMGDTFANVNKTIAFTTGATGERLDELNASVRSIAKESPKAMSDIASAIADVAKKTDLTGQPLEDLTKRMMKLDTLGRGVDVGAFTQSMRAFGVPAGDMSDQLDRLYKVSTATGMGIGELAAMAGKGAPQFKAMGMSLDDTALMLGSLHKAGVRGEQVTIGLNKAMINLAKGGGNVKEKFGQAITELQGLIRSGQESAALEKAGGLFGTKSAGQFIQAIKSGRMNVDELKKSVEEQEGGIMDAGGAITTMSGAWQMMKNNVLILLEPIVTKIFGSMQSGIKWFRAEGVEAIQKFGDKVKAAWNSEEIQGFITKIRDTFVAVWPKITSGFETTVAVVQKLTPILGPVLLGIFSGLVTAVTAVANGLSSMVRWISENKVEAGLLAVGLAGLFGPAILAGIAGASGKILGMLKNLRIVTAATKLWAIATKVAAIAMRVLNLALVANPIGLIIVGLTALAAGLVMLYKRSETFRNIVTGAWNAIKGAAMAVVNWFRDTAWPWLQKVWDGIADGVGKMIGFVRDHWRLIISIIGGPIGLVVALVTKYWDQIKNVFSIAWEGIKTIVGAGLAVFRGIGDVLNWLWQSVVKPVWDGIKAAIGFAWDGIKFYIDSGLAVFRGIGTVLNWLWQNVVVPVWNGIKDAIAFAWGLIQPVIEAFKTGVQIAGDLISGVWNRLVETVKNVGTGIKDGFMAVVNFVGGLPAKIAEKASGMWDGIKNAFKAAVNWIIDGWNRIEFKIPGFELGPVKFAGFTLGLPDIPRLADGGRPSDFFKRAIGMVRGAGGPTDDMVPSLLSNSESVNTAKSTAKYWPMFARLNRGVPLLEALRAVVPAFATGGAPGREPYGLPVGSSGPVTVPWVQDIERRFGVKASTYAGHQEKDGQNKGIDWSGPTSNLQRLAEYARSIRGELEQAIWMNPETGEKIGVANGELVGPGTSQPGYYAADWADHTDHLHTRQSYSWGSTVPQQPTVIDQVTVGTGTAAQTVSGEAASGPKAMTLGEWIARRIFGNWNGAAAAEGASSSGASVTSAAGTSLTSGAPAAATSVSTTPPPASPPAPTVDTIPLKRNPDGTYSSTDPEWDRLLKRESGGRMDRKQEVIDANSGGNEASGGFQIAKGTWARYGGTKYAPTAGEATPEQQAEIAAKIFNAEGGRPWGSGLAGRESDDKLRAGIQRRGAANPTPGASPSPTVPDSAAAVDPKKLREAQDKADDAEKKAAVARTKLAEVEANPKAKESAKQAARDNLERLEREAKQAKDDLAALKNAPTTGAPGSTTSTGGSGSTGSGSDKPQIIVVLDGQNVDVSEVQELSKILAGGVLETIGLDGSWLPNPAELGIVKMTNALLGIKFTEPPWMSGQGEPPPWIDKRSVPFSTKPLPPQQDPNTTAPGMAANAFGMGGFAGLVGSGQRPIDASLHVHNPQGDPDEIAKRVRRAMPDQRTRLNAAVPVGR
ncbi:tape measure protein [Gordonia phage DumpsterDude]|uniref:Tape measure protein n=1 Tax=Gordonia phage DumpsterDude TaxID=2713262 RepID=A0A6G8R072_9CAUD|nr:tail length tape measure protein [Gordonia phage DumpsterDude]QIN93605.1 tape measure protein [Gordonia phage DumpsterDude]